MSNAAKERNLAKACDEASSDLQCNILIPREFLAIFQKEGSLPTVMDDQRRFPRYHYHMRAVLHYRQTLPAVPRGNERYIVLTKDISRGGLSFLHEQKLFPRERMVIEIASERKIDIEIARCIKHNDRCFEIGATFLEQPPECEQDENEQ